jgi:hypothetical protein
VQHRRKIAADRNGTVPSHVRFGSEADIAKPVADVRLVPKADVQAVFGYYCWWAKGAQVRGASPVKLPRREFLYLAAGAAALSAASRITWAQAYPTRPVRIIVGFPGGIAPDIVARVTGQALSERLGRQFVIENRPGAGSNIATETVVRASPDGYTLLMVGAPAAINATLYSNLNFNVIRDIVPVTSASNVRKYAHDDHIHQD